MSAAEPTIPTGELAARSSASRFLMAGGIMLGVLALLAVAAPLIAPHDPEAVEVQRVLGAPDLQHLFGSDVHINIFNVDKINKEESPRGKPRMKRLQETIGESYYAYLSRLDDLVLLMDEAHRYRASAGANAIDGLRPISAAPLPSGMCSSARAR